MQIYAKKKYIMPKQYILQFQQDAKYLQKYAIYAVHANHVTKKYNMHGGLC